MSDETRDFELIRLRREQRKTREDEVFLGSSAAERVDYEKKEDRIREIERNLNEASPSEFTERRLTGRRSLGQASKRSRIGKANDRLSLRTLTYAVQPLP